jgi:hypothetical protein
MSNASRPTASKAIRLMKVANFRALHVGSLAATSGETSPVRFNPSGVASNAQETNTARIKPSASKTVKAFITHEGASKVGRRIDAACIRSQEMTT